jgi:hypothetical protein
MTVDEAWRAYHQVVGELRAELLGHEVAQASTAERIHHYLAQIQAFAYHQVIAPRQQAPVILGPTFFSVHGFRMGMQSPNFLYRAIYLDGSQRFRLFGRRGASLFHQLLVMRGGYNDERPIQIGEYDLDGLIDAEGAFDLTVGGDGADIALDPESGNNWLFLRECFADWDSAEHGDDMDIDTVSDYSGLRLDLDDAAVAARILGAARLIRVLHTTAGWPRFKANNYDRTGPHVFSPLADPGAAAYNPAAHYLYAYFDLADDEALLLEADAETGSRFWDICSCDVWGQNSEFVYHQASLTGTQARPDPDGRVRIVVSPDDPGVPNWIDTVGLTTGTLMWRYYWPETLVQPECTVVKRADLRSHLPGGTPEVSPAERQAELRRRRRSFTRRYRHLL